MAQIEFKLTPLAASLSKHSASAPGLLGNSNSSAVVSLYVSLASSSAFLARRASSTTSSTVPLVPCAVPRRARMFTLAFPNVRAISATVPGRFSIEIVNCLVLAMLDPPNGFRLGIIRLSARGAFPVRLREMISTADWGGTPLLRQQVFERLNTGGVRLSQQEIRNSIYHGNFNSLLLELVKHPAFRTAWGIPVYRADEDSNPSDELLNIPMYAQMRDVEIVLRFFALRHAEHYKWGMAGFLDLYMVRTRKFTDEDIHGLNQLFIRTI